MSTLYDGATGLVIPDFVRNPQQPLGFGPTVQLLEVEPFRLAPWMTPALAEQEIAMLGTKVS